MDVGFIGLGSMGEAIASVLRQKGNSLTVYNRTPNKANDFARSGGKAAATAAETVKGDIVFSMLADDDAVENVFLNDSGDGNLITKQAPNTVHVSLSTISVRLAERLTAAHKSVDGHFVSATVMGRPDVAAKGQLVIMAAGSPEDITKCRPLLDQIGKIVHFVGEEPSKANVAKVAANFMISSMLHTFGEAFALVRKNGVDEKLFCQIMAADFFASPIYAKYGQLIVDRNFDNGAFTVKLQEKDTRLALQCAQDSQVPMPFAAVIENTFLSAIGRGMGDLDPCVISKLIADNAGIKDD